MAWQDFQKHWQFKVNDDGFMEIICPTMHDGFGNYRDKREVYREFKEITQYAMKNHEGWIGHTQLIFPHVMRMFVKMGAQPFFINLADDNIYFIKAGS